MFSGVQIYRKFYTEEKEMSNGVLAISVSKPTTQPYDSLAKFLSVSDDFQFQFDLLIKYNFIVIGSDSRDRN